VKALQRSVPLLAGLVCLGVAAVLVLLALDARAWQHRVTRDDLRFRALHSHAGLWRSPTVLPGDPARLVLGAQDAIGYRRALQLFWFSRVGTDPNTRLDLPTIRAEAEDQLQQLSIGARTGAERSNAANLLGVLTVTTPSSEGSTMKQTLRRAADYFGQAIGLDPANYAAKLNLELVLRLQHPGKSRFGRDARAGFGFGRGHGATVIGSGY
jgi:hypothetical protein